MYTILAAPLITTISAYMACNFRDCRKDYILAGNPPDRTVKELQITVIPSTKAVSDALRISTDPLLTALQTEPGDKVSLDVPFTTQAPTLNWRAPYDEACEEATLAMAAAFINKKSLSAETADTEIKKQLAWEKENNLGVDISLEQISQIAKSLYGLTGTIYRGEQVSIYNIKQLLSGGYPVIIAVQGQDLGNPNFLGSGPPYHVLILTGYDSKNFIANDPGTSHGQNFLYPQETILNALHNWTGSKSTVRQGEKAILVLTK